MIPFLVAACAAAAAWLSQATLAFTRPGGDRLALLPMTPAALAIVLLAGATVAVLVWRRATAAPVLLLLAIALPWVPLASPAFLLWSGPVVLLPWAGVLLALVFAVPRASPLRARIFDRPAIAAGALACAIYGFAAWQAAPSLPGGDEPHYLVITQSLLYDRDLEIENNHRRGDYRAYFGGELRPDYLRRGRNGEIYSIHAPGLSALVLPAFAIAGYRAVVVFLILLSSIAAGLVWHLGFRVTGRADAAWFGWAAVVLAPTTLLNAFTVYPDGPGALAVLTGIWALVRARDEQTTGDVAVRPWVWHGAALAILPWLHTRFALLAGGIGALVLLRLARTRNPVAKACAFLAVPTLSAIAWIGYFAAIYGAPDPAIPYRGSDLGSPSYVPGGLAGLCFDQQFGLFVYAPVLALAFAGAIVLWRSRGAFRLLPVEAAFVGVPYLITVTHFAMWWAGFSAPARFALPLVPVLGILVAAAWAGAARRGTRVTLVGLLALTGFISAVLVMAEGGRLAYHDRELYARWLQWLARVADLQRALPSFFAHQRVVGRARVIDGAFYGEIAVWIVALVGSWGLIRAVDGSRILRTRARLATAAAGAFALAGMLAASVVWRIEHANGSAPVVAQLDLLRTAGAGRRLLALDLSQYRVVAPADILAKLVIEADAAPARGPAGRDDRPIFTLPAIPAGEYRLTINQSGGPRGLLMIGIGRDQFSIVTQPADAFTAEVPLRFPVEVRGIMVRGDDDARRAASFLRLRPVSLLDRAARPSDRRALHVVRYSACTAFFMDDRSYPEPNGFWIVGASESAIVLQPDAPRASASILVRNAPVSNQIDVQAGRWNTSLALGPGEERHLDVPLDTRRGATLLSFTVASGFKPSAVDPRSHDERFLGVWVTPE